MFFVSFRLAACGSSKGAGKMLLLSTLLLSGMAQAQSWVQRSIIGQHFNYQLGQVFVMPVHQIAGVKVYGVDLFDTPASTVARMNAAGLVPVCYFSTQYEDWRPDAASFPDDALGSNLDDWAGERYVDTRRAEIRAIMVKVGDVSGRPCSSMLRSGVYGAALLVLQRGSSTKSMCEHAATTYSGCRLGRSATWRTGVHCLPSWGGICIGWQKHVDHQ
eukprot:GHRQ01029286.1.p1 GENE.GHRQ01029286.1~~GHRQ01029286.1.p1  ORF type:complete len:217 (+),score=41.05 GHRQ01029286.1:285-935(+)